MKKGIIAILISLITILIGLNNVNASTIVTPVELKENGYFSISNTDTWLYDWGKYYNKSFYNSTNNSLTYYHLDFSNNFSTNHDYITYSFSFSQPLVIGNVSEDELLTCSIFQCSNYDVDNNCNEWSCSVYDNSSIVDNEYITQNINNFNFNISQRLENGDIVSCDIQNNNIVCPLNKSTPKDLRFYINFKTTTNTNFLLSINNNYKIYDSANISSIITEQEETNNILNGEQNYNKEASEEVNGKEEINDYTEKEEQLFSSLNFEGIGDNEIVINPNTSSFIWEIIDRLRGMNGKIVLLMTSILGLGIIKMVLNR